MQALCSADYQDTKRGDPSNAVIVQRGCRSRVGKRSGQVRPAAAMEAGNSLMIESTLTYGNGNTALYQGCLRGFRRKPFGICLDVAQACCAACFLDGSRGCWFNLADRIFANPDHSTASRISYIPSDTDTTVPVRDCSISIAALASRRRNAE